LKSDLVKRRPLLVIHHVGIDWIKPTVKTVGPEWDSRKFRSTRCDIDDLVEVQIPGSVGIPHLIVGIDVVRSLVPGDTQHIGTEDRINISRVGDIAVIAVRADRRGWMAGAIIRKPHLREYIGDSKCQNKDRANDLVFHNT